MPFWSFSSSKKLGSVAPNSDSNKSKSNLKSTSNKPISKSKISSKSIKNVDAGYLATLVSVRSVDIMSSPNVHYSETRMEGVLGDIDSMSSEQIIGIYVFGQPVKSQLGTFQHWSLKFITNNCYVYMDFRICQDSLSSIAFRPFVGQSYEDTQSFYTNGEIRYNVVSTILPQFDEKVIESWKKQKNKYDDYDFLHLYKYLKRKNKKHYKSININKTIGDLKNIIMKWNQKNPKGYHWMDNNCQTFVIHVLKQLCFKEIKNNKKYYHYSHKIKELNSQQQSILSRTKEKINIREDIHQNNNNKQTNSKHNNLKN